MASQVLPKVRLLFACDGAVQNTQDKKWVVKHPWSLVQLPPGAMFPFKAEEVWVCVHLPNGVGQFDLMIEVRQVMDDGTRRLACQSRSLRKAFPGGSQLLVFDEVFHMKKFRFAKRGSTNFV